MPPKRAASSSSKRKAEPEPSADDAASGSQSKKKAKVSESAPANAQPTNKVLPTLVQFPPRNPGTLRIASWNVSGLAACQKKGFKFYVEAEDPDILILTETKVNNEPVDPTLTARFPHQFWSIADKKGYSGTAILSKHKPLSVTKTLPGHPDANSVKGRVVTLEFEKFWLIGTYVVNAGQDLKTLAAKEEWNRHFETYIRDLDAKKPVIWAGDLNVAPTERDLTHAKRNWNKTPGYTESETKAFARILDPSNSDSPAADEPEEGERKGISDTAAATTIGNKPKFTEIWRHLHPDDQHYTYFSYRFNCREKGIGWRLDMFVLSERVVQNVKMCEIRSEIYGASDHCPVVLEIEDVI